MKTLFTSIFVTFFLTTWSQINFSYQINGASVTFSLTQQGQFYESVKWDFGDGTVQYGLYNGSPFVHTYSTSAAFQACVMGYPMPFAQIDTACKQIFLNPTAIKETLNQPMLTVGPNPVKDKMRIEFTQSAGQNIKLSLINALGQTVFTADHVSGQEIDMSFLNQGIYYLKAESAKEQKICRIVKE